MSGTYVIQRVRDGHTEYYSGWGQWTRDVGKAGSYTSYGDAAAFAKDGGSVILKPIYAPEARS